MFRSGTLVFCLHNLDCSGANQVILNLVEGKVVRGHMLCIAPKEGPLTSRLLKSGASVRIGSIYSILENVRDVSMVVCNSILTADIVVGLRNFGIPVLWILHEWWSDKMITENLELRGVERFTRATVFEAMHSASHIVCVCEGQKTLYRPSAPCSVIFAGTPAPSSIPIKKVACPKNRSLDSPTAGESTPIVILVLGIVCPRKNQVYAVQLFKELSSQLEQMAESIPFTAQMKRMALVPSIRASDLQLRIVGVRYSRQYEMDYVDELYRAIDGDERVSLYEVTDNVSLHYRESDILLFPSKNEVTPLVIMEAMSYGLPIVTSDVGGVSEMVRHNVDGYVFEMQDDLQDDILDTSKEPAVKHLLELCKCEHLREAMGRSANRRYKQLFQLSTMMKYYRKLFFNVDPPRILVDMDGVLVDWDKGFHEVWQDRAEVNREQSYYMENCVNTKAQSKEAVDIYHQKDFFASLPPMEGSIEALKSMQFQYNFQVYLCTTPVLSSRHCLQEKADWVTKHLGADWLSRLIFTSEKSIVKGDVLIDDKPRHLMKPASTSWLHILYEQPYNKNSNFKSEPDENYILPSWKDWETTLLPLLHHNIPDTTKNVIKTVQDAKNIIHNAAVPVDDCTAG